MTTNTAIAPYRTPALVEALININESGPKTGLILSEESKPHKCNKPEKYYITKIIPHFWGLFTTKKVVEHEIPLDSLYRCPGCLVVSRRKRIGYSSDYLNWETDRTAIKMWEDKTGEAVGEP